MTSFLGAVNRKCAQPYYILYEGHVSREMVNMSRARTLAEAEPSMAKMRAILHNQQRSKNGVFLMRTQTTGYWIDKLYRSITPIASKQADQSHLV